VGIKKGSQENPVFHSFIQKKEKQTNKLLRNTKDYKAEICWRDPVKNVHKCEGKKVKQRTYRFCSVQNIDSMVK